MIRLAKIAFLLMVFSLPFMKLHVMVGDLAMTSSDLFFLVAAAALAMAVINGETKPRWIAFYAFLLAYFAAMLVSVFVAADPGRAALKLATQAYLLSLPVLAFSLIGNAGDLRNVFRTWLAATAIVALVGTATVLLFALGVGQPWLGYALHQYGTLPPGNYPRLETTFDWPAMLCNYLTVSLMILLVSRHLGWIGRAPFWLLLAGILVTAVFSLTPGLGGIFLAIGVWLNVREQDKAPAIAVASLVAGGAAALLFVLAAVVTPILHPTAPFIVHVPGLEQPLAPSVRLMTWMDAAARFMQHPLLGIGIGSDAVAVRYIDPSGNTHQLTDAHNVFLNFAVQCGLLGLAAMIVLIAQVARMTAPFRLEGSNAVRLGLGLAWLNAFAYQGITGSYEDARHLWLLLGLLLAGIKLEPAMSEDRA